MPTEQVETTSDECLAMARWSLHVSKDGLVVEVVPRAPSTSALIGLSLAELFHEPDFALVRKAARRVEGTRRVVACGVVHLTDALAESSEMIGPCRAAVSSVDRDGSSQTLIQLVAVETDAEKTRAADPSIQAVLADDAIAATTSDSPDVAPKSASKNTDSRDWSEAVRLDAVALSRCAEDGLCCVDESGHLIFANEQWGKMLGSAFRDKTTASLVVDGDQNASERLDGLLRDAITAGRSQETLLVRPTQAPDKVIRFTLESADTLDGPLVYVGAQDLTPVKEAESRFRRAIEGDGDGIFDWDFEADHYFASSRYWQIIGRPDQGPFGTAVEFFGMLHPDDVGQVQDAVQRHIDGKTDRYEVEYRLRLPDGHYEWMESRGRIAPNAVETRRHFAGSLRSIQRQKELEASLRNQVRQRDNFLATLSHELRNPLGAIANALAVLEQGNSEATEGTDCLDVIRRQTEHVSLLLNDLLDVARISQNKLTLKPARVNLDGVIRHVVDDHRDRANEKNLNLSVHTGSSEIWLRGDRVRLTQCVDNLITNAIKYTPSSGRIDVYVETDDDHAVIRVADTGIGLTDEVRTNVFEMFAQAKQSIGNSDGGIGVGLALVRLLAESHGGTISADSPGPNQGSEFELRLPIGDIASLPDEPEAVESESPDPKPPSSAPDAAAQIRLVLIDDLPAGRDMLAMWLRNVGFHVETADNGHTGLSAVDRFRPEAVLIDIGLPDMPGHDVARELRARESTRDLLLVAVTGYGRDRDARKAKEAGFDAHFAKPVDLEKLRTLILDRVGSRTSV